MRGKRLDAVNKSIAVDILIYGDNMNKLHASTPRPPAEEVLRMDAQKNVYFGFPLDDVLYERLMDLIVRIRQNPNTKGLSRDAANIITDLLNVAIRAFYYDVMEAVPTHPNTRKSADAGVGTVVKGTQLVIQKMVTTLDANDLTVFAGYMETLLIPQGNSHYIAYPLTPQQRQSLEQVVVHIQSDPHTDNYNHLIVDMLCQLTDQAIKYFYDTPTRMIQVRSFIRKSADLAVRTVCKGMHFVIKQLFRRTRQKELMLFSNYLQQQLVYR